MDKKTASKIFHDLYKNIDGYELSRKARLKLPYEYKADVYGEIDFNSFYEVLKVATPKINEIFYDLGSGTGKAVILAALCFPFSQCIGVEYLKELYEASVSITQQITLPTVQFFYKDFMDCDFTNGDIIYLNSYYFEEEMSDPLFLKKIESLKNGTRIIFVQTPLIKPYLKKIHEKEYTFSWGKSPMFIMEKI